MTFTFWGKKGNSRLPQKSSFFPYKIRLYGTFLLAVYIKDISDGEAVRSPVLRLVLHLRQNQTQLEGLCWGFDHELHTEDLRQEQPFCHQR